MKMVIHGGATDVHPHGLAIGRLERLFSARERVIEFHLAPPPFRVIIKKCIAKLP